LDTDASDPNYKTYHELQMAEKYARKLIEHLYKSKFSIYMMMYVVLWVWIQIYLPLPFKIYKLHELYANDILLVDNINEINNWNYNAEISETGLWN
jgi:hypothetical protein